MTTWDKAQAWEKDWWSNCTNTLFEEEKQLIYAEKMGLDLVGNEKTPYVFDLHGASVVDIGGGACSLLLKCVNFKKAVVIDPLPMPRWIEMRYKKARIDFIQAKGEDPIKGKFDECVIYNVLQHVERPDAVIRNVQQTGRIIRIFEWINTPISDGHIHTLKEEKLNEWLGGEGKVEIMNKRPCFGKAYYGVFPI